jgi:hypothetical protein
MYETTHKEAYQKGKDTANNGPEPTDEEKESIRKERIHNYMVSQVGRRINHVSRKFSTSFGGRTKGGFVVP